MFSVSASSGANPQTHVAANHINMQWLSFYNSCGDPIGTNKCCLLCWHRFQMIATHFLDAMWVLHKLNLDARLVTPIYECRHRCSQVGKRGRKCTEMPRRSCILWRRQMQVNRIVASNAWSVRRRGHNNLTSGESEQSNQLSKHSSELTVTEAAETEKVEEAYGEDKY